MGKSQQLSIADVRAVFHILNELRDLGAQPEVWKRHMLCELCRLIGGQVGICVQTENAEVVNLARSVVTDVGWAGEKERNQWIAYCRRNDLSVDPSRNEITRLMASGRPFVRLREQLCPDFPWYSSDHVQITRKASDVDSFIFSYRRLLNPDRHHWLYLLRPWNDHPFSPRQRRLVRLFHSELGLILDQDSLRVTANTPIAHLSPRQRQTLDLLSAGLSEKQVAIRLACSRNTVHGYIKELHKKLGVNSRSELLVKVIRQNRLIEPQLKL